MKCSPFPSHNAAKLARGALDEIESRRSVWALGTLPPGSSAGVSGRLFHFRAKPKYG